MEMLEVWDRYIFDMVRYKNVFVIGFMVRSYWSFDIFLWYSLRKGYEAEG